MKNFTLCLLMFCGFVAQAQLTVSNTIETPQQLVQNVLVAPTVTPTNVTYNGAPGNAVRQQTGHFTTNFNGVSIGLSSGVIMSTGNAASAIGPNNSPSFTSNGGNTLIGDADLSMITPNTVTNVSILEFDFVATGLELNFDYVFASEEYPEYVYSTGGYNDTFGFFLSGPGINGPYSNNAKNIAVVPNTVLPITVNTINNGFNNSGTSPAGALYYVNNTSIGQNPYVSPVPTVQYDGFTTVLRATSALICGGTYHIKLAIANCGDQAYDSAVFLENFRIKPLELLANNSNVPICPGLPIAITSGVVANDFIFTWTEDGVVIPGETTPSLNIPPVTPTPAVSLIPGHRYQVSSLGATPTATQTDFTLVGASSNALGTIFIATGAGTGTGTALHAPIYNLKYYTASGCLLGTADYASEYFVDLLADVAPLNICTSLSAPYSLGDIDPTLTILNGAPAINYDIRYFYTQAEAEAPAPTAGIPSSDLSNFIVNTNSVTIWARFEELVATGCISIKIFPINIFPAPSGTFSYPASPYCAELPQQPITTTVTPGGTYSATPAGLSIDPATGNIDPSASTPNTYTVSYFIPASASCPAFTPPVAMLDIIATPAAPSIITPLTYCQGETASALSAVGSNLLWYSAATGGTGSATAPTPTTTTSGAQIYYVSQTSGCEGPRAALTVNVNPTPASPTFTAVSPYCQGATATALTATGTNLIWYTDATTAVGSTTAPIPSTTASGTINYYVTQTVNNCESLRVAIPVTVNALPAAPTVTSPITYCQNDTPAALVATGTGLLWYSSATGGVGNATAPTVNTVTTGSVTYFVSQTVNGCEGPRASITVNITTIPAAPTVTSPVTYCEDTVALPLSATGTGLLWYTDPTTGVGNSTAPTPSTSTSGTTTYYVSQTIGCESPRAAVVVNITPTPIAPTVASINYCQNSATSPLTATGTNLLWYTAAIGGTGSASAPTPSSVNAGLFSYFVTQTVNGCESPRASLDVTIIPLPAAPTVTPQIGYCQGDTATNLSASGTGLLWYASAVGGIGNTIAPTPTTSAIGNTNYYVSQTVNGCEGSRALITVSVFAIPSTPVTTVMPPTCAVNTGTITINSPLGINLEYSINNGTTYQSSPTFPAVTPGTSYDVRVRNTISGCTSSAAVVVVGPALAVPTVPTTSVTNANCYIPTATIEVLSPVGPDLEYTINGGTSYQSSTTFGGLTPNASYTFTVRNIVSGCTAGPVSVNVSPITANPAIPTFNVVHPICTTPTGTITVIAPTGSNLEYSIDGGTTYQASTAFIGLAPNTNYTITVRDMNTGCISNAVQAVNPIPANPNVPTYTTVQPTCSVNTGSFVVTSPVGANYQYSNDGGVTYQASVTFSGLAAGTTYSPIVKDVTTGCVSLPATVAIAPALNVPVAPTANTIVQPICSAPAGTILVSGPTGANLSYSINAGTTFQASTTFVGLPPGTYNIIVKDNVSLCTSNPSLPIIVNPLPANPPTPTFTVIQPICTTPTATITVLGPTGSNLEYSINGGTTYQLSTVFAGLAPNASYTISVRDVNTGCVSSAVQVVNPIPLNPGIPTGTMVQPTCAAPTGSIAITSPLGTDLEYSINGGASYQSGTSFTSIPAGVTYNITVRNTATGCVSAPGSFTIIPAPTFPTTPVVSGSDVCVEDSIALTTPTVAGASYAWTGPNGFTSSVQNPVIADATISMSGTYSVIISTTSDCPSLPGSVTIAVNPLPVPTLAQDGNICFNMETNTVLDPYILNAGLSDATNDFVWFVENGGGFDPIGGATASTYSVSAPGIYGVIATNISTGCVSQMITATVTMTSPPLAIAGIESEYFADLQTVSVNVLPVGNYEYQMDNGAWQNSSVFIDVLSGTHTVRARNRCGILEEEVYLLDYPRFFTPNADGYNDTWNIFALSSQPNSKIYIFDRYGKLLKEISPSGTGWDGTYNKQLLPATDYWFQVNYEENKINKVFKSHFALKR